MDAQNNQQPKNIWQRLLGFDSWVHSAASLSIVTLLAGWLGTYIQYLNSYEQKVSETAQADMKAATETFVDISNAFAQAQMLQQLIYYNYYDVATDAADKEMASKAAKNTFPEYVKSRNALRQNTNIYARKAELNIDWASNLDRDPADTEATDYDPLTETLLGTYNFNCDAAENFPHYEFVHPRNKDEEAAEAKKAKEREDFATNFCKAPNEKRQAAVGSETVFCAATEDGKILHEKRSYRINWFSAKHHLIVMHYCFEQTHGKLKTARMFASETDISEKLKDEFKKAVQSKDNNDYQKALNQEVIRFDAFLSLVMSQLERIRVKYRPTSFYCSLPLVGYVISDRCTPVRIAKSRAHE